ncbi:MFS transporter [Streptomyces sp. NPDC088194]|uniref:MFS transporter n=1 Tax=Streptomyces sp. NPDC088194 TaxID=3154931 RepID=UPI0034506EA1
MASLDTTDPVVPPPARTALPRSYLLWLAGTRASLAGDAALAFALGWAASARGGRTAALVLTAITLPRAVFLLVGGAVGDRFGARRVMIAGDVVMLAAVLALAVAGRAWGAPPAMLLGFAAVVGTVDAFYLPATGSMPRRLVGKEQLPRALAVRQAGGQVAALLGAPLGAVLVAVAGLSGTALVDAATFAAVLAVMAWVRPAAEARRSPRREDPGGEVPGREALGREDQRRDVPGREVPCTESLFAGIAGGVRLAAADPVLRPALLLTAVAAAGVLPVVGLLAPLLARSDGWGPGTAGLVAAGQGAGVLLAALVAARRGPLRRIGAGAGLGLVSAAVGAAALAAVPASAPAAAVAAAVLVGTGSGVFACHLGPLVLAGAPDTHLSRVQSLLALVQSLALVVGNNALGWLAHASGPRPAIALCATLACLAGLAALTTPPLRSLRHEGR